MAEFNLSLTELNEVQNHDDFEVVWCSSDDVERNKLPNFVDYLKTFDSSEKCGNYIKQLKTECKIFLVLINLFEHLSNFDILSQIQSIYVLKKSSQNFSDNEVKYSKRINIFTDEHELIERLRQDILVTCRDDLLITISCLDELKIEQSLISLDETALMFIWNQLFIYYLVNSPSVDMNQLKQDMVEQCRLEYKNDSHELTKINHFINDCTSNNVLDWYTRNSFVYRLVNKAFRKRNIPLICRFRYFIVLLYNKLKELSIQQEKEKEKFSTVYRGQILGQNELKNLQSNIGHLMSFNTVISTTHDSAVARAFIADAETGVIFQIQIVRASNNILHPFADISQFSTYQDEEEVLLFAGAVFRIDSVEKENSSTWIIKLTLSNETVDQIEHLMDAIKNQLADTKYTWDHLFTKADDLTLIGEYYKILTGEPYSWKDIFADVKGIDFHYVINNVGNHEKMIEYYKKLLSNETLMNHPKRVVLHIVIGYNYSHLFQYDNALHHYDNAVSILDERNQLTGKVYNHIGDIWKAKNNFESALSCYEQALQILDSYSVNGLFLAKIYRKMSDIYRKQSKDDFAIIHEEQANEFEEPFKQRSELDHKSSLKSYQNQLNTQPNLSPCEQAYILYEMGVCLIKTRDYSRALETLLRAKQFFDNGLPTSDRYIKTFSAILNRIASVYLNLNDNFNALIMLKRVIDMRTTLLTY